MQKPDLIDPYAVRPRDMLGMLLVALLFFGGIAAAALF